jgi:general secretion pathway protein G
VTGKGLTPPTHGRTQQGGFTLIELLVVLAIIGTLLSLAVPRYFRTLERARETVLKHDLAVLREAIDKHYADLNEYPDSLPVLVEKRYVRAIPIDPFTRLTDTWTLISSDDPDHAGIRDVHSGAAETAADGTAVSSW